MPCVIGSSKFVTKWSSITSAGNVPGSHRRHRHQYYHHQSDRPRADRRRRRIPRQWPGAAPVSPPTPSLCRVPSSPTPLGPSRRPARPHGRPSPPPASVCGRTRHYEWSVLGDPRPVARRGADRRRRSDRGDPRRHSQGPRNDVEAGVRGQRTGQKSVHDGQGGDDARDHANRELSPAPHPHRRHLCPRPRPQQQQLRPPKPRGVLGDGAPSSSSSVATVE